MFEIIALYFLCKANGKLAAQKGLKPSTWRINTIVAWLVAEIIGVFIGIMLVGKDNLGALAAIALVCAFGGYLYIRYILDNKPDAFHDEVKRTGVEDLSPPRNRS